MVKTAYVKNGGPGCGKGTDAKVIAQELGLPKPFEMGPFLLERRKKDAELNAEMERTTDQGLYVSDRFLLPILAEQLDNGLPNEFIADGITRTREQTEMVLQKLRARGYRVVTLNYDVPPERDDVFYERMKIRNRAGETRLVQQNRVATFRKHNPGVIDVFKSWPHHFCRDVDGTLEHPDRCQVIRVIIRDAPGSRPIRRGLVTERPLLDQTGGPAQRPEFCSER